MRSRLVGVLLCVLMPNTVAAQSWLDHWAEEMCGWESSPVHASLELAYGITAEIIHYPDCYDQCDSDGCISHIILAERVYQIRGSQPFRLSGSPLGMFGQDGNPLYSGHPVDTAIGWIQGGKLLTGYWNGETRELILVAGKDVTGGHY